MITETQLSLRTEIEMTREKFHRWLVVIPESKLPLPSNDPEWTNGEILYRISVSPLFIRSILKSNFGSWTHRVLPRLVTGTLVEWGNEKSVRAAAQNLTLLSLAKEYEYNCKLVLDILDHFSGDDFSRTVRIPEPDSLLASQVTIEQLFHYVKKYFDLHRKELNLEK